ncbi:MAG: efflux RND transporter periplasmic adaptor subunit [bacterium]
MNNWYKSSVILLTCLGLACNGGEDKSAADLSMPVVVEKVKLGTIAEFIASTGTLQAQKEERVIAEVPGILHLAQNNGGLIKAGARVKPDQILAELENPEYLLEIRVESQKLAMTNAQRELAKQEVLFKEGGVTEKELEIARRTALDARLNYETAILKAQKLQLKAPISGILANLPAHAVGTRVPAGFQFCTVMDYENVIVRVNLPNSDMGRIQPGQKVNISNYALQDEIFIGQVVAIDPAIDPQTRTFTVTIQAENRHSKLRPGMFVKTDIVVEEHSHVVIIPKSAMQTRDNRPVVFVVQGVSAELRQVETGIEGREEIEIVSGLAENERLVVKGQETLRDKSKVRVTE